jgi:cell division protein FtsI (penicillin-binding protein 3)
MVKPLFIREIKAWNRQVKHFDTEVTIRSIASEETIRQIQEVLKNTIIRGTGKNLYSENFSMAGKTGTARTEYGAKDWSTNRRYISSFAGYFPAESPKYSCIVVIHKPSTKKGIYGADVSGPVFKRIALKIYTDSPLITKVEDIDKVDSTIVSDFEAYYLKAQEDVNVIPNVTGMPGMDALSLLENLGLNVKIVGNGTVFNQSIKSGTAIKKGVQIILKLS